MTGSAQDDRFRDRALEVAAYRGTHGGSWPSVHDSDPTTRSLGLWVRSTMRARIKSERSSALRQSILDELLPGWIEHPAPKKRQLFEHFCARVAAVAAYREAHGGEWPSAHADDVAVNSLGGWLLRSVVAAKGVMAPERIAVCDEQIPGWRDRPARPLRTDRFRARAIEVAAYREAHGGEWPGGRYKPEGADARSMRKWVIETHRRWKNGKLSVERIAICDELLPGWQNYRFKSAETRFRTMALEVAAYRDSHDGAWPQAYTRYSSESRRLGQWLKSAVREPSRSGTLSEARRGVCDELITGWEASGKTSRRRRAFEDHVRALADYYDTYGAEPSSRSKDPEHKRLAQVLNSTIRYQARNGLLPPERLAFANATIGWWDVGTKKDRDHARVDALKRFVRAHGRYPLMRATDPVEHECAKFLRDCRRGSRSGGRGWSPERGQLLDAVLPGWRTGSAC